MHVDVSTDDGWMHKAVQLGDRVHIIEEIQLFRESQPINNLIISQKQVQTAEYIKQYTANNTINSLCI